MFVNGFFWYILIRMFLVDGDENIYCSFYVEFVIFINVDIVVKLYEILLMFFLLVIYISLFLVFSVCLLLYRFLVKFF